MRWSGAPRHQLLVALVSQSIVAKIELLLALHQPVAVQGLATRGYLWCNTIRLALRDCTCAGTAGRQCVTKARW
jgi:hypothetical protein